MSALRSFEEFIKTGIVKKQNPDISRAEFLLKESEQNYQSILEMLEKIEITNKNANNYIKNFHDILMQVIRAKMLLDGFNASGFGAHEAEVAYLRNLGFSENDVQFANQIRFFRNGILYYGTILDKEYALKVIDFFNSIYSRLKSVSKL